MPVVAICGGCEDAAREFLSEDAFVAHVQTVHPELVGDEAKTPSGANAPYKIRKQGNKHVVVNNTGEVKATFDSRPKAVAYLRALYVNVKGAPKRAEKVKFSGKARQRISKAEAEDEGREFKAAARKSAAKTGAALPDGSFPIKTVQDLKNAIQALGRAKNKARAKAHIIARAKALGATKQLPKGWGPSTKDSASSVLIDCPECARVFLNEWGLVEHADAVHTFNDIERMVSEAVREKYAKRGNYDASPPVSAIWAWVVDVSEDWVVFTVEQDSDSTLYKASYTILDNTVTLGEATEVTRKTVYEAISS